MNSYEEKQEARRQYYESKAEEARQESADRHRRAREMGDAIPFGQPVHGARDRRYREKIGVQYEKAAKAADKAAYYESKAASIGRGGISSDDPDAIEKLKKKLEGLKADQEMMKAANKAIRMKDTAKGDEVLKGLGYTEKAIAKLREGDFMNRVGYPAYALQNNGANIRRIEERIKDLETRAAREAQGPIEEKTELYEYREEDNRCQFIFDGKPSEEVRAVLKGNAFKWSPSRGAWVRQATVSGRYAAEHVKKELAKLEGDGQE